MLRFFRRKTESYPPILDYSQFQVDIHSHLIPGIDDGAKTIEESLILIRSMKELGFKKLVTTPHIIADSFGVTYQIISNGLEELKKAVKAANIDIQLEAAGEYYMDEQFDQFIKDKQLLTIGGKYVLFEVSYMNPPESIFQVAFDLQVRGYAPLLAHPERYPYWHMKFDEYRKLKDAGIFFQLNTNSLSGYYGSGVKKVAERLIDEDMIDFVGSDLHGERHLDALRRSLREDHLYKLASIGTKNTELYNTDLLS